MTISIIIPFAGSTADLVPDLKVATDSAELIIVDNASDGTTRQAITEYLQPAHYIRNDTNLGFAAANNQGYARATGDIIIFLNSDIAGNPAWLAAAAADICDGALYGPSLQQQLVAGRWLPYLEGWCLGATRVTWDLMRCEHRMPPGGAGIGAILAGPWDSFAYPDPYWEDNDLCFRAMQAGISLVQTGWGNYLAHKGGRTAGPIAKHGASFAKNQHTFSQRVLAALDGERDQTPTYQRYLSLLGQQSDIQHHLPLLYSLARGNVVELGTRTGVSTAAFLAGVERRGGHVWSVDIGDCSKLYPDHPQWTFVQSDSRNPELPLQTGDADVLLVDTKHDFSIASAELALWGEHIRPGGFILMHDPETFPGVRRAALEFARAREWPITFVLPCNGMAIIERPK